MTKLFLFLFSTAALTYGVTRKSLFRPLREKISDNYELKGGMFWLMVEELFTCQLCFGFWAGMIMYGLIYMLNMDFIGYALSGSAGSYLFYLICKKLK